MSRPATLVTKIEKLETHPEQYVRIRQVAEYFNVSRGVVIKWVENGLLKAMRLNGDAGEWRFKIEHLIALERSLTSRARAAR